MNIFPPAGPVSPIEYGWVRLTSPILSSVEVRSTTYVSVAMSPYVEPSLVISHLRV